MKTADKRNHEMKSTGIEKALAVIFSCFVISLFVFLPFFFWEGYTMIATRKWLFFLWSCRAFFAVLLPLSICQLFLQKNRKDIGSFKRSFSVQDILVMGLLAAGTITFLLTFDRALAWTGCPGWNMGFETLLLCVLIYAFTSRLFHGGDRFFVLLLASTGVAFLWGFLNRMGIRIFPMRYAYDSLIGPIGNINWFAGFFSVTFPAGISLFLLTEKKRLRIFAGIYLLLGIVFGLFEGSDSAYLILLVLAGLTWFLFFRKKYPERKWLALLLPLLLLTAAAVLVLLIALNTWKPGSIGRLSTLPIFTFDLLWGTFRGTTMRVGALLFRSLSPLGKIFGAGQDCFGELLYSVPEARALSENAFSGTALTNAHNEPLTSLVNTGVVGTVLFYAVMLFPCVRTLREKEANALATAAAMCIVTCLLHNLVSFETVMNFPYLFFWLGVMESVRREAQSNSL